MYWFTPLYLTYLYLLAGFSLILAALFWKRQRLTGRLASRGDDALYRRSHGHLCS